MPTEVKKCSACQQDKTPECFAIRSDTGKPRRQCITCRSDLTRKHYEDVRDGVVIRGPKPVKRSAEAEAAQRREYYQANKEKHMTKSYECALRRKAADPEAWSAKQKERYYKNHSEHLAQIREYNKTEPRRKYQREAVKKRRENNIGFRLLQNLRSRIKSTIRKAGTKKANKSLKLIGCSPTQLVKHIESQFYNGMTWADLGGGHGHFQIDHIKPCCSFDMTDPAQQRECFHWTNLQPLWYKDHTKKSAIDMRNCKAA